MNNLLQEIYTQFPGGLGDPSLTPDALFTLLDDLTSQRERWVRTLLHPIPQLSNTFQAP